MPFLSRVWMNPLRPRAQLFLSNPHALHAAVLGGISRQPVAERVLWRLDLSSKHRAELLVLTDSRPSWEHLVEQAGWPGSDEPQQHVRDYQPLLDRIQLGREFRFRVRANPVSSTTKPLKPTPEQAKRLNTERPRGVRVPHRTAAHQLNWFTSRIGRWGFELAGGADEPAVRLIARDRLVFSKSFDSDTHRVVLNTATIDGIVRVTDPQLARHHLLAGVGPAKGYGCGLITLAPLNTGG